MIQDCLIRQNKPERYSRVFKNTVECMGLNVISRASQSSMAVTLPRGDE